jgi:hypothetical protein
VIPYVVDQYYNTRNINGTYTFNNGGSYSSYTPNSILSISRDCFGKSLKLKITAFIDSGDSTSLEVPLNLLLKETIQAGPFNLGAPKNQNFGQFFLSTSPNPIVSVDPYQGRSSEETYSNLGYFQQNGENRLGALSYLFPLKTQLGYTFQNYSYSYTFRSHFRKVSQPFEAIDALYLDTMKINETYPEVLSIKAEDVIVFINSRSNFQKGVLKIHNIIPGDSGFVSISCKYQKL